MIRIGDGAAKRVRWHFHRWTAWSEPKSSPWTHQTRSCVICRKTQARDIFL